MENKHDHKKINSHEDNQNNQRTGENDILSDISKTKFWKWLKSCGYDISYFNNLINFEKQINSIEQCRFNIIIRKVHDELKIDYSEILVYLDEQFYDIKKILSLLDGETFHLLKNEMAKKYKIHIETNDLYKMLG